MRRIIGLLLAVLLVCVAAVALASVTVDEEHFPDEIFRGYVSDSFDKDGNGVLSDEELAAATKISCTGKGIQSLDGIQYFTSATQLLCYSNSLTALDVSSNTALIYLNCWDNQLKKLDVSALTELTDLRCSKNELTKLNLANNKKLKTLRCYETKLTSLDLSKNKALVDVRVNQNEISTLKIGSLETLTYLDVWGNKLTSLDVSGFPNLKMLYCSYNSIDSLDLSANPKLAELACYQNPLTTVDTSANPALVKLDVAETPSLTKVDVSRNRKLKEIWLFDTSVTTLDISNCPYICQVYAMTPDEWDNDVLDYHDDSAGICLVVDKSLKIIAKDSSVAINKTNFPDEAFRKVVSGFDTDGNEKLSAQEIAAVTHLDCSGKGIGSLKGIGYLTALLTLDCSSNELTALDVSGNFRLEELKCCYNLLTSLEIGINRALTDLSCYGNRLATLDVSYVEKLKREVENRPRITGEKSYDYIGHQESTTYFDSWGRPDYTVTEDFWLRFDPFVTVIAGDIISDPTSAMPDYPDPDPEPDPDQAPETVDISGATITSIKDQVYTGKAIKPSVTVKYNKTKLIKGTDYKVSYKNNKKIGKATVTVTGIGNYTGKLTKTFRIIPKAVTISSLSAGKKSLTVKWKAGKEITGYEIEYSLKKNFTKSKTVTISKAATVKTTIKKLTAKKTYYVRIRAYKKVGSKMYYSAWSKVLKKKTK